MHFRHGGFRTLSCFSLYCLGRTRSRLGGGERKIKLQNLFSCPCRGNSAWIHWKKHRERREGQEKGPRYVHSERIILTLKKGSSLFFFWSTGLSGDGGWKDVDRKKFCRARKKSLRLHGAKNFPPPANMGRREKAIRSGKGGERRKN